MSETEPKKKTPKKKVAAPAETEKTAKASGKEKKKQAPARGPAVEVIAPGRARAAAKEAPAAIRAAKKAVKPAAKIAAKSTLKKAAVPRAAKKAATAEVAVPEAPAEKQAKKPRTKSTGRKPMSVSSPESKAVAPFTLLTEQDLWLFNGGKHFRLYDKLGSRVGVSAEGKPGTYFSVWAPDAERVSLIGDWNGWQGGLDPLARLGASGVWAAFVPGVAEGARYKYRIESRFANYQADKADPFAFTAQVPPEQASIVAGLDYEWQDCDWL